MQVTADATPASASVVRVVGLRTDYVECPLGIETSAPVLSWRTESNRRGVRQSAYRVVVASSEESAQHGQGDLWDSGRVASSRSLCIGYQGRSLRSRLRCWWRVEIWDDHGSHTESAVTWWEMGLLSPQDWTAQWLAVEDAIARADRQVGLHWISGSTIDERAPSRRFRLDLQLPMSMIGGVLFVGSKSELLGLWIDGTAVPIDPRPNDFYGMRPLQQFTLPSLAAGGHLIAVEVIAKAGVTESLLLGPVENTCLDAMTAFLRLELAGGGALLRIGAGPAWRTSTTGDSQWFAVGYDDRDWEQAMVVVGETAQPWPATAAMHLRREFVVGQRLQQARLYITALGAYEARLNGSRIGDALLAPESSYFTKRTLYRVHDVTSLMLSDSNVLGLTVGDGWFAGELVIAGRYPWLPAPRRVLAQLELTYSDGSRQTIGTGPGWHVAPSPIVRSEIYDGETYDARQRQTGWDTSDFDASQWEPAATAEAPPCRLTAQVDPPIRAMQVMQPRVITSPAPRTWVFDFGQNFAGWCRLRAQGPAGTRIEMRFGEVLLPSGAVDQSNLWAAKQTDVFILRGDVTAEIFEPHFTYHGFRYVEVTGLPAAPDVDALQGVVIHSDLPMTGALRVDEPLIQRIWSNTLWTQRSNFVGIATDCPQRRERLGWFGDAGVFWDTAAFNMDVGAFTRKLLQNAADNQNPDGSYSFGAPFPYSSVPYPFALVPAPGWGEAPIILTWTTWRRYGDAAIIEQNWEAMNRHVQYVLKHNFDGIWRNKRSDYGDWLAVDGHNPPALITPHELIGTAYWAHAVRLLAEMADATGRHEAAASLRGLHSLIRRAFIEAFVRDDGRVGNETQTSYVLALKYGLVPDELREKAAERLVGDIRARGGALSTGFLGTQYILDILVDVGHADLAHDLLLRTRYPSWGYMIERGATTMWESWNGRIRLGREDETVLNSYNHCPFGSICGFLFRRIAGIDAAAPGFTSIVIRPTFDARIGRGGGDYDSMMGRISTDWVQTEQGVFALSVTIPANTTARVHLPVGSSSRIEEAGIEVSIHNDVRMVSRSGKEAVVEIGSGVYRFLVARSSLAATRLSNSQ